MKHTSEHTCESVIYHEQNSEIIKRKSNIQYYPELNPTPQILDAGKHILLGNLPEPWTVVCSSNDPIPNPIEASRYLIIKKKHLCQCSIGAGTWFIQENIVHCEGEASSFIQLYYTTNMAVMIYDFQRKIEEAEIRDISLFTEPIKYDPIEIDLVYIQTQRVIGDRYERLAFERVMKNRDKRMYANKIDYMMDTNEATDIFSGNNKYQTIFIIIFTIIICLFGNFLGLSSHFQKMLITVNKIAASIKTLLPISLPHTVQAAIISHGDTRFHIDYVELWFYMVQFMVMMIIFVTVIWICIQLWKCINTRNIGRLQQKFNCLQFLHIDKTDFYL